MGAIRSASTISRPTTQAAAEVRRLADDTETLNRRVLHASPGAARRLRRRGVAATELACVLPLLVLVCVVCVDFGRVAHSYIALSNAARVGAEYGATHQFTSHTYATWESKALQASTEELQSIKGFNGAAASLTVSTASQPDGLARVSVDATYPFEPLVQWPGLPSPVLLHRQVTMRQYQ